MHEAAWREGMPWQPAYAALFALARAHGADKVSGVLRPDHAGPPFSPYVRDRCIPMIAPLDDAVERSLGRCPVHFSSVDHF